MTTWRILSWNVNGLRAVLKKGFSEWLIHENPDILCIQETKLQEDQLPEEILSLAGYSSFFSFAEKKGYSGVALFSKHQPKSIRYGFGIERFDTEGRILIAEFDPFTLFNIYYPNGKASAERLRYKMEFYNSFLNIALDYSSRGNQLVICGDVNTAHRPIDLARPRENETVSGFLPEERAWIDTLISKGYLDTLRCFSDEGGRYTWWDYKTRARERNIGWRIDYFFISESLRPNLCSAMILADVPGSDHCPVGIELDVDA
jgi:exodeoxyribonuclease-3